MGRLAGLFSPERVAVVGATDRPGSVGRAIVENLLADFSGEVVAVNPNEEEILGLPCHPTLRDVPDPVDLAVVAVPVGAVVEVVRDAGEAGIENVVVITAGFSEAGSEGASAERELADVAEEYGLNLVGPNCVGVIGTPDGLNATFAPQNAEPGPISFMSQSGAFITAVLDWAADNDVGFRNIVSLGNELVLDECDFAVEWGDDPGTEVILGYLEDISDGRRFIETARQVTRETPLVVVKSGRTQAGAQAASSHTGAIAGNERAYEAGLEQAGVIRAESVEELFDTAQVLAGQPLPETDGVAIVTNAGGPGVMATDAVGDSALRLASFGDDTLEALETALPDQAAIYNPVDVIGDADLGRFREAIDLVLADENVGGVVVLSCPTALIEYDELAAAIADLHEKHGKPVVAGLMGGERTRAARTALAPRHIPNYFDPARAVRSMAALAEYRDIREREYADPTTFDVDRDRATAVLRRAAERGEPRVGVEAMSLLDAYGIPTPAGEVATDPDGAVEAAHAIGGPVVMKIVSPDILHKSDIGGVKVGVPQEDVRDAYEDLVSRAHGYQADARILGVQVQEPVDVDAGTETIVGMNRDPQFGPLLMFGLGGIFVEVLEDTAVRVAPVSEREARTMTESIDSAPLLRGARGREPVALDVLVETVQRLSQLVTDFPAIQELDVNPLVALPDGVSAVDLRLTVDLDQLGTPEEQVQ